MVSLTLDLPGNIRHALYLNGQFAGGHDSRAGAEFIAGLLRRILARELERAANARVRRELRKVADELKRLAEIRDRVGATTGEVWRDAASIVEGLAAKKPKPVAWNWCTHCKQLVDADDIHDGSVVRCLGCNQTFVCVSYADGSWSLEEQCPCEGEDDDPGAHTAACPWSDPNYIDSDSGVDFDAELAHLRGQGPDPWPAKKPKVPRGS